MRTLLVVAVLITSAEVFGQRPTISFTFDDGRAYDQGGYSIDDWNAKILNTLDSFGIKAAFFVCTRNMESEQGQKVIKSWSDKGHIIANHTYSHPNFNKEHMSVDDFEYQLLKADSVLNKYEGFEKLFRFPYLKEGDTKGKVDSIRYILTKHGYSNGHVTIDASDWYIDSKLVKRYKDGLAIDIELFKKVYLEHLLERATYFEDMSYELNNRHVNHTLLLHHNLSAALFLSDLIEMFKSKGWKVISAKQAFEDAVFKETPSQAGGSLVLNLAMDAGNCSEELADSIKYRMERVGL